MTKRLLYILFILFASFGFTHAQLFPKLGAQRAGISSLTFLNMDVSPRSTALGGANVALKGDGYSVYTNPAALVDLDKITITTSNTFWAAGINNMFTSVALPNKSQGVWAFTVSGINSGAMKKRTEFQPEGTGEYFYATAYTANATYSKVLSRMFSYGLTLKFANETLAEYQSNTFLADMGFLYKTDFKELKFAVYLHNFGLNSSIKGDYTPHQFNMKEFSPESYPSPTVFRIGASMVPYKDENHQLVTALQLNHPGDNAENIRGGIEYIFKDLFFARLGYKLNVRDQIYPTGGMGVRVLVGKHLLYVDYGAEPTRFMGFMHKFGLSFMLNRATREETVVPTDIE
jgi:hypothetical protein